jgi:hypothetical protein
LVKRAWKQDRAPILGPAWTRDGVLYLAYRTSVDPTPVSQSASWRMSDLQSSLQWPGVFHSPETLPLGQADRRLPAVIVDIEKIGSYRSAVKALGRLTDRVNGTIEGANRALLLLLKAQTKESRRKAELLRQRQLDHEDEVLNDTLHGVVLAAMDRRPSDTASLHSPSSSGSPV